MGSERYDLVDFGTPYSPWREMRQAPDGEWIRYEDHEADIEKLRALLELAEKTAAKQHETIERLLKDADSHGLAMIAAEERTAGLEAEVEKLRAEKRRIIEAGRPMATWLYNVAQHPEGAVGQEACMREMWTAWDAALAKYRGIYDV